MAIAITILGTENGACLGRHTSHQNEILCQSKRRMCGELVCCNLVNIMRFPENEALAISLSTSPEPYHTDGNEMDWLTGIPFERQQASGGFYLCLVLSILTWPWSGPRASHFGPSEGERGERGHGLDHLLSIAVVPNPPTTAQPLSSGLPTGLHKSITTTQAMLKLDAVDCQPGMVASVPCNLLGGQPCTDESGSNQR